MATTTKQSISFEASDGVKLAGWLFSAGEKAPTVIMTHGFSAIKELSLENFASRFQAAGYTTLVYDNRNFGESSGTPRFEVDPIKQTEDYHDAISFAASLPDADPDRIAIWGSSYSGGNVIQVGAIDRRIKAVITQVPFMSGEDLAASIEPLLPHFIADRSRIARGEPGETVSVVANSLQEAEDGKSSSVLSTADAYQYYAETKTPGAQWENKVTLQSLFKLLKNEPQAYIHRVSPTPFFMCIAENDSAIRVPSQLAAYERAGEPKELLFMPHTGHFEPHVIGPAFDTNINAQIAFLQRYL